MISETSTKQDLFKAIDEAVSEMKTSVNELPGGEINKVPYKDSWTVAELFNHVTKSAGGMAKVIDKKGKVADRDPAEKIAGLKSTFLDFSKKFNSPDFIVPDPGPYTKEQIMGDLEKAVQALKKNSEANDLSEMAEDVPFGPVTKLEALHFSLFHTQRHLHQLKKICAALA